MTLDLNSNDGGVLFKEFYFPGWRAFISDGHSKQEAPIYVAGPGFMYVSAKEVQAYPSKLSFEFGPTWEVLTGDGLSILSGILAILVAVSPTGGRKIRWPCTALGQKIRNWWLKD